MLISKITKMAVTFETFSGNNVSWGEGMLLTILVHCPSIFLLKKYFNGMDLKVILSLKIVYHPLIKYALCCAVQYL